MYDAPGLCSLEFGKDSAVFRRAERKSGKLMIISFIPETPNGRVVDGSVGGKFDSTSTVDFQRSAKLAMVSVNNAEPTCNVL